jgi:uncharacterized protein with GYD domain
MGGIPASSARVVHPRLVYSSVQGHWSASTTSRRRAGGAAGVPVADPEMKGGDFMETYIMLTKLTDEGRKTLKQNPNRTKEVNREIEGMGGKIVGQYAVLGPYDYVNVVEAPDNKTIAKISMELGSRGTMEIMTLPAVNF